MSDSRRSQPGKNPGAGNHAAPPAPGSSSKEKTRKELAGLPYEEQLEALDPDEGENGTPKEGTRGGPHPPQVAFEQPSFLDLTWQRVQFEVEKVRRTFAGPEQVENDPVAVRGGPQGTDRTVEDDVNRIRTELSRLPPKIIQIMKNAALADPQVKSQMAEAKATHWYRPQPYYGSELHKRYGALVERLTGGVLSAEEAMRMNPSGGRAGPGMISFAIESGPLAAHAIRHDAEGFLKSFFSIGPGYGGFNGESCLSGQFEGIEREIVKGPSKLPDASGVGAPSEAGPSGIKERQGAA